MLIIWWTVSSQANPVVAGTHGERKWIVRITLRPIRRIPHVKYSGDRTIGHMHIDFGYAGSATWNIFAEKFERYKRLRGEAR
jgi:hypothetical protein